MATCHQHYYGEDALQRVLDTVHLIEKDPCDKSLLSANVDDQLLSDIYAALLRIADDKSDLLARAHTSLAVDHEKLPETPSLTPQYETPEEVAIAPPSPIQSTVGQSNKQKKLKERKRSI